LVFFEDVALDATFAVVCDVFCVCVFFFDVVGAAFFVSLFSIFVFV